MKKESYLVVDSNPASVREGRCASLEEVRLAEAVEAFLELVVVLGMAENKKTR